MIENRVWDWRLRLGFWNLDLGLALHIEIWACDQDWRLGINNWNEDYFEIGDLYQGLVLEIWDRHWGLEIGIGDWDWGTGSDIGDEGWKLVLGFWNWD